MARLICRCVALVFAVMAFPTWGQGLQQFKPAPGSSSLLGLHSADTPDHLGWQIGLSFNFAHDPLVLIVPATNAIARPLINREATGEVLAAMGLLGFIELGMAIPITMEHLQSSGALSQTLGPGGSKLGMGDLRFVPKFRLFQSETVRMAVISSVIIPTGQGSFQGEAGVGFQPRMAIDVVAAPRIRLTANLGADLRPRQQILNLVVGNDLSYGAGMEVPFALEQLRFAGIVTVFGSRPFSKADVSESPLEALCALRMDFTPGFSAQIGGGAGLISGYGAPDFRLLAAMTWRGSPPPSDMSDRPVPSQEAVSPSAVPEPSPPPTPHPSPRPSRAAGVPPRGIPTPEDTDGDGVPNDRDLCPDDPGDDANGCPADDDHDGIINIYDLCPNEPETYNGYQDEDGCPDEVPKDLMPKPKQKPASPKTKRAH